jgi:hypothetical protein
MQARMVPSFFLDCSITVSILVMKAGLHFERKAIRVLDLMYMYSKILLHALVHDDRYLSTLQESRKRALLLSGPAILSPPEPPSVFGFTPHLSNCGEPAAFQGRDLVDSRESSSFFACTPLLPNYGEPAAANTPASL